MCALPCLSRRRLILCAPVPARFIASRQDCEDRRWGEHIDGDTARLRLPRDCNPLASSAGVCHRRIAMPSRQILQKRRQAAHRSCAGAGVWHVLVGVRACSTLSISAAYGGLRSRRASRHFTAKNLRVVAAALKQGRCPAANAVGSSRKNSSVYERPQTSRRRPLKSSTRQIHFSTPTDVASISSRMCESARRGCP